ncbi:hypothetical protein [Lactobacillus gasseri]|uniref:Uncharacterized protein n=1 Tax=Lactobacillus gasseri TaxID=1596 RepID=A0A833FL39_LACGS|nr:hypothetical protein [Lactobacillus gasseri]KAB1951831.1 hypothetical protein F8244_04835 [Lactobacillus gasseri]
MMKLNEQQKFMLKKLDACLEITSTPFLDDSEHFSYLVNHVLAKLGDVSFTELTTLTDAVDEIIEEDME